MVNRSVSILLVVAGDSPLGIVFHLRRNRHQCRSTLAIFASTRTEASELTISDQFCHCFPGIFVVCGPRGGSLASRKSHTHEIQDVGLEFFPAGSVGSTHVIEQETSLLSPIPPQSYHHLCLGCVPGELRDTHKHWKMVDSTLGGVTVGVAVTP